MYLRDILKKISSLPWTARQFPQYDRTLIRSGLTVVAVIENTRDSDGKVARDADAIYIAHVCSVAPRVAELLFQAINSEADQAQIMQEAFTLITKVKSHEPESTNASASERTLSILENKRELVDDLRHEHSVHFTGEHAKVLKELAADLEMTPQKVAEHALALYQLHRRHPKEGIPIKSEPVGCPNPE